MIINKQLTEEAQKATKLLNENILFIEFRFDNRTFVVSQVKNHKSLSSEVNIILGSFEFEGKQYFIFR